MYDITEHIVDHPGWDTGCGISTVLSILAHVGTECSIEFHDIHRSVFNLVILILLPDDHR